MENIIKWLLSSLQRKSFQELPFKAVKNRKHSGYVDCQRVRSIDQNLSFSKLKLLILRQWWQLWMKSAAIKQRCRMNLFFVVFCLIVLLPNSMSKLIHNWCKLTCTASGYTAAYVCANEQLGRCFYVLVCDSLLFSSQILLLLRLGDYSTIFTEPEANNC